MPKGSKCLFDIAIDDQPPSIVQKEIIRRVEANTGRRAGKWEASVTVYGPDEKRKRPVELVSLSDVPGRMYMMLPNNATEVEPSMLTLMLRVTPFRIRMKRAVKGEEYDFEDFGVRVGVSFDKQSAPYGVIVEIEYRPCAFVNECEHIIVDMMDKIVAALVPPPTANNDPSVNHVANKCYKYRMIKLDDSRIRKGDLVPFSHRTTAWLYSTLLGPSSSAAAGSASNTA